MNKTSWIWMLVVVAVLALLAIPKLMPDKNKIGVAKMGGKQPPVKVGVYVVSKQDLVNTVQAVGNILAEEEVELRCETQGRVVKIGFEEGQEVKKGTVLVKLNDADLQAQLKRAQATKSLKSETEKRNKQLLDKGGISQEMYDMSLTDLNTAAADIDLLKEQIRRTEVIAPFDGLIGLRNISVGSFINNTGIIAGLQNIKRVKIEFSIPEKYVSLIGRGSEIIFTVEGQTKEYNAKVYAIEPKIDPINRNVIVRAMCENKNRKLLPGSFAKVKVQLHNDPDALMIPTQSVVPILKGQKVFLVKGDSVVEQKIEIGTRTDLNVEVINGLKEGDSVVVNGVIQLKQGSKVTVAR